MKKYLFLLAFFSLCSAISLIAAEEKSNESNDLKYICARDNEDDSVFTDVYETQDECRKYCTGIGTVCEATGKKTPVDTTSVDF